MIPQGYVQGLVAIAEEADSKITLQHLRDERDTLFKLICERRGKSLVSSSVNGKTFQFAESMTVAEAFAAISDAIAQLAGTKTPTTYANFNCLLR